MKNPNRSGSASGTVISAFLSLFFIGIVLFILIGIVDILDYDAGAAALVFEAISLLSVAVVCGLGSVVKKVTGTATFASIVTMTVVYTIVQLIFTLVTIKTISLLTYVLVSLIILFLYSVIVLPIGLHGAKNKND